MCYLPFSKFTCFHKNYIVINKEHLTRSLSVNEIAYLCSNISGSDTSYLMIVDSGLLKQLDSQWAQGKSGSITVEGQELRGVKPFVLYNNTGYQVEGGSNGIDVGIIAAEYKCSMIFEAYQTCLRKEFSNRTNVDMKISPISLYASLPDDMSVVVYGSQKYFVYKVDTRFQPDLTKMESLSPIVSELRCWDTPLCLYRKEGCNLTARFLDTRKNVEIYPTPALLGIVAFDHCRQVLCKEINIRTIIGYYRYCIDELSGDFCDSSATLCTTLFVTRVFSGHFEDFLYDERGFL